MKHPLTGITLFINILITHGSFAQVSSQNIIAYDIDNFWVAYDKITSTKDSAQQFVYLNKLFLEKGSEGLKAMMQARSYSAKSYIDAINSYPLFWNSIRGNTLRAKEFAKDISAIILKLKNDYPDLKPARIYFTVGALRSGGTTRDSMVLIGSELTMADKHTVTKEFPREYEHLRSFFDSDPINSVVFTNVHEYVHTQQKTISANYLLGQCVLEGVAEFIAELETGRPSFTPAISYGKINDEKIRQKFSRQLFNTSTGFWLYSNAQNEFNMRDLGYYVGYAICEKYYRQAQNKKAAIRDMIELDYNNDTALYRLVDSAHYFAKDLPVLRDEFEKSRPTVVAIKEFKNYDNKVSPGLKQISVVFSGGMDTRRRNFQLGPLGEDYLLRVKSIRGWSEDNRSISFEVELLPGKHYQIVIGDGFRDTDETPLKPFLIDFTTAD